jgi:protein gp37
VINDRVKKKGRLPSLFLLSTNPVSGIWFEGRSLDRANSQRRFRWNGGVIEWHPFPPPNAELKVNFVEKLVEQIDDYRRRGNSSFMRLSGTTKTGVTWSLPAVGSCPIIDETCSTCYALDGFYRTNIAAQVGRVMRHEYLKSLIASKKLAEWVDWISNEIRRLSPVEPIPENMQIGTSSGLGVFNSNKPLSYMRWHDSGDIFHEEYCKAIFEVCRKTDRTAHWLPTRMSGIILKIIREGQRIPGNLAVQVSCHKDGALERAQIKNVNAVLEIEPESRIGVTYDYTGNRNRSAPRVLIDELFGSSSYICPATVAKDSKDRVCSGCRRCWSHTNVDSPVIYATHFAN